MEKKSPIDEMMYNTLTQIQGMANADTIIGTPIHADGVTLIPISKLSFGVIGGGTEFSTKHSGQSTGNPFGGGSGASAKIEPVAFLIVKDGGVRLLHVTPPAATTVDRVIETVPEVVDKITGFVERQQEKKEKDNDDFVD